MSPQMIHCHVTAKPNGNSFLCTFIYGYSDKKGRELLWQELCTLANFVSLAWVIMGDFNVLMAIEDRIGSAIRLAEIQPMRSCTASCQLNEVKIVGSHFTWNKKQDGPARVFTRIDRVLANSQWEDTFPTTEVAYLLEEEFDHFPMVMSCYKTVQQKKPFRFYHMWINSESFLPLVETNWNTYPWLPYV